MPRPKLASAAGSASNINATQAEFRQQISALNDIVRQLAGNANVAAGSGEIVDPLTAPFTLYVNSYIGSDTFASGSYNTYEEPGGATDEEKIAAKLKRLDTQRLTCGYTASRPFKTINRAVIEAAIITSKNWYTFTDPRAHLDCVSIILAPGVHTLYNDPGSGVPTVWVDGYEPSTAELIKFNPTTGGVLLPRGCSLCGADLRKITLRPSFVPTSADELGDWTNRREMLKITGSGYFFGFTFMDKVATTTSHHLLSAFGFASKAELDAFYAKVNTAVGASGNISATLMVTRSTEYKIVGPIDDTVDQDWDTTASASPYVFNCSIRSEYGMGGIHSDGAKVEGLKSIVTANFTGVSLQKDMTSWQLYNGTTWITMPDYATYISSDPNNVRMNPARRSYHIRAINNAFVQEVSVFCIGQGVHHCTEAGGEITITNSNSSFGGCVALSRGYKPQAFTIDKKWRVGYIRVPLNPSAETGNVQKTYLGTVVSYADGQLRIDLAQNLEASTGSTTVPKILADAGYTLRGDSYIWVENPTGTDWRCLLAPAAWNSATPNRIVLKTGSSGLQDEASVSPGLLVTSGVNRAVNRRVYIRRLVDTRDESERKLVVGLFSTAVATRLAQRDYILQLDATEANPYVSGPFAATEPLSVSSIVAEPMTLADYPGFAALFKGMEVQIRRTNPSIAFANSTFYRAGTTATYNGKHFTAVVDVTTAASGGPTTTEWQESFVHTSSDHQGDEKLDTQSYPLVFDNDTANQQGSLTLGFDFTGLWTVPSATGVTKSIQDQYRSSNDYRGTYRFLLDLGFSDAAIHAALQPQVAIDRRRLVNSLTHFPTAPSGGLATTRNCWAVEFRRPSVLRLFSHAFEWAGTLNYTKAFPSVQQALTPLNKFNYYFTNALGGKVYVSGFNEEGFIVKATGIEDLNTGQNQSITALALASDDLVTEFPTGIAAGGTSTFSNLTVLGQAIFALSAGLSTDPNPLGPLSIATLEDLRGSSVPASDTILLDNNQPKAVTNLGLNYWKDYNKILSAAELSYDTGTEADEYPVSGMLGRMAFVDEWCGYAQGGGTVTQLTSKATGVTLSRPCGQITLHNAALAAATAVSFTLTNAQIAPSDVLAVSIAGGATAGAYAVTTTSIAGGSAVIALRNLTAGSLGEAVVLNFVVIKSTTAV